MLWHNNNSEKAEYDLKDNDMDYLKKEIFYPIDGKYDDEIIKEQRDNYVKYLDSIIGIYPKSLMKLYLSENWFHDYCIKSISVSGTYRCYGLKSDIISLELCLDDIEIKLEFSDISYFKLLNENKDSCWVEDIRVDKSAVRSGLEEIVLCELGVVDEKTFKIEFLTSNCAIFEVHFGKVKVHRFNKRY